MRSIKLAITIAAILVAAPSNAGLLVVGGDTTSTFSLDASPAFGGNPGNRAFYANILGGAKRVLISDRTFTVQGSPSFANMNLANFYKSLGGVSVAQTSTAITANALNGVGLLVLQFPNTAFSKVETAAIGGFVRAGGTLLLAGEASAVSPSFPAPNPAPGAISNAIANDLLADIGATIRLGNDSVACCGTLVASGGAIATDPLTQGVDRFNYGYVSSVSGGTSLLYAATTFNSTATLPFFASERLTLAAVPEPGTWTMTILGFGLVGAMIRRRASYRLARARIA